MPPTSVLDVPRASWLAGLDPALARLPEALPPSHSRWSLHDVRWDPGSGCRLAYRIRAMPSDHTFVSVDVRPDDWWQRDYRDDPLLPGLASASTGDWVAEQLARAWGEPVLRCRVMPVRYRPGSHCVLRYVVRTPSGVRDVHAKVFEPGRFREVIETKTALTATAAGAGLVPSVVAVWPESGVVVESTVSGRSASAVLGDPGVSAGDRASLARQLGRLLADFHRIPGVAPPHRSARDQVASLTAALGPVLSGDRTLGERLAALLGALEASLPDQETQVLAHGGFRSGQVIVAAKGLVILDTDGLCRADIGLDLGSSMAHLRWQAVLRPDQRQVLLAVERAFLAGYESRAGAVDPAVLPWWRAVGLLQVAARRYRRLEVDDWPSVPALVDHATDMVLTRHGPTTSAGATELLDPQRMTGVLRLVLARSGAACPALRVESAEVLGESGGRRAVVRYRLRGASSDDAVLVVGKRFTEIHRARLLHENLRLLCDGPLGAGSYRVPEPLGLLPEQGLVLYRSCDGVPLDRTTGADRAGGIRLAAQWLAQLHTSDVGLPRSYSLATEQESTREWAALVARLHPHLAAQARALASEWVAASRAIPPSRTVPIHKDFHAGHVLIGDSTWVIDLDEARQGDPALDLAHFCAYLDLLPGSPRGQADLFLEEYSTVTGWRSEASLRPFLAYAWLKIAKQWAVGSGPCRAASPDRRAAGVRDALRRGWKCLSE